jgi:hypothetical protein
MGGVKIITQFGVNDKVKIYGSGIEGVITGIDIRINEDTVSTVYTVKSNNIIVSENQMELLETE